MVNPEKKHDEKLEACPNKVKIKNVTEVHFSLQNVTTFIHTPAKSAHYRITFRENRLYSEIL